ncbi:YfgM family protein [Rhodoferax sp.]|uniref:YfgM family protein n=1 Tax=Rhodoferax sp. TaxID=50421 RepID=UPI0027571AE7|nr:tetratricopeptide repeat protein [Rhodoferax sp.]
MANQLDLEEQEQLDQLKHFWKQYGNQITWLLIIVLAGFASWNVYQYWQRNQASQASAMYDEVERVMRANDMAKLDRAFTDMKDKFGSTTYAQQAGLLVAKSYYDAGKIDSAKAALAWVADKSSDEGYQAIARLRLAAILLEARAYDEALKQLVGSFPADFQALAADRKGDIFQMKGDRAQALVEYNKAYKALDERTEYRRVVEIKLNALGVDPREPAKGTPAAASQAASATVVPALTPEGKK